MHYLFRTFEALEPRRKAYSRIEDDTEYVITLIIEAINSGNSRTIDIFNYVKEQRGIDKTKMVSILNDKLDELWIMTPGDKKTKHYHLL